MKSMVGIDLGGTKIRAGAVYPDGTLAGPAISIPTRAHRESAEEICSRIAALVETVKTSDCTAIGIGSTGPVSTSDGMILDCNNQPSMNDFPICSHLQKLTGLPVCIDSDARTMILGEALCGAGKGYDRVLGLTLGTGLGCALIDKGVATVGSTCSAGEIWTSPYKDGIIEDYVSGTAIEQACFRMTGHSHSAAELSIMARNGDSLAQGIWDEFASDLAYAIAWLANMSDPDIIVLGGSVAKSSGLFLNRANSLFRKYSCRSIAQNARLCTGSLGDDAGVIGAVMMARTLDI